MATDMIPSVSLDNFLQQRDAMIERAREAQRLLREVDEIAKAMPGVGAYPFQCRIKMRNQHGYDDSFTDDDGMEHFIKLLDASCWSQLLDASGMRSFMDADARKTWDEQIKKCDVPPLTRDTIEATFSAMRDARGDMLEGGVVKVFKSLSWDYKTNQPVGFGKRFIVRYLVDDYGLTHFGGDKIDDMLRVMSILDDKPQPDHRARPKYRYEKWPDDVIDLGYFSIKRFKNGNGHVTFTRPDLVQKLNQIVAKHYPGMLPPHRD